MEINLSEPTDEPAESGGDYNIDEIMANPQVQGIMSAIMKKSDIDPTKYGLPDPDAEEVEAVEGEEGDKALDAVKLNNLLGKIIAIKGDDLTLGEMQAMVQNNPEQVNTLLQQHL